MAAWIDTRWFWTLLILTLCGEFLLPCLLARKDPAYRPGTMAVSVLGRRGGPVARVYRLWLAWLGIWLLTTAAVYAVGAAPASRWLAAGLAVFLGGFALGAGILAALFPTGLTKDLSDRSALIHGIASALGFFALLFLPLWRALLALGCGAVLMKGGHLDDAESPDWLFTREGEQRFTAPRVQTKNTHGTGCTLSAALAALRPRHADWAATVIEAKAWLSAALAQADSLEVGHGIGPVHHFHAWW